MVTPMTTACTVRLTAAQARDLDTAINYNGQHLAGVGTVDREARTFAPASGAVGRLQQYASGLDPYFARTFAAIARKVIDERGQDD